jgi:hypothetical protein
VATRAESSEQGSDPWVQMLFATVPAKYARPLKSRSMVEMIFRTGSSLPMGEASQSGLVKRIRELREELNWYYHRIELEQLRPEERSPEVVDKLQAQAELRENELLRMLRELPAPERDDAALEFDARSSLERVQACLPPHATLLEYYLAADQVVAAVVTRDAIEILPVTVVSRVLQLLRLLRFQLSKFRLGPDYAEQFS